MPVMEDEEQAGVPEWMVTFSDMMSLLLTFFIMLVSMSEIKEKQRQALVESLRKRFGHDSSFASAVPGDHPPQTSTDSTELTMGRAQREDTMMGGAPVEAVVGDHPRVQSIRKSPDESIGGVLHFPEAVAELSPEHKKKLYQTAALIRGKTQKIDVRGHTSPLPLPPDSPYRSRWDLAYSRCYKTMDYLIKLGIDRRRIHMSLLADNDPVEAGADPLQPQENDRVEVLMLDDFIRKQPAGLVDGLPGEAAAQRPGAGPLDNPAEYPSDN